MCHTYIVRPLDRAEESRSKKRCDFFFMRLANNQWLFLANVMALGIMNRFVQSVTVETQLNHFLHGAAEMGWGSTGLVRPLSSQMSTVRVAHEVTCVNQCLVGTRSNFARPLLN
jgi:hypothetical protein